jgi:asparagine synthase (glutamine-hydrolysing)
VLNFDGSAVTQSEVERIANLLKPYGPDRQKILRHANAAFVMCLQQFTPEDLFEQQPLQMANRFIMLFDGRIDNRSELSTSLGIASPELQSMSDSMIAFRLFDRWGERAFERIVGDFAIIVLDLQEGCLLCARDHMGMRALHYHRSTDRFAVATNPEVLFGLSWVPRILNKDKVGDALVDRGLNGETTYYQEIFRVLPGCIIRVRGGNLSKHCFWDPHNSADIRFKNDHEYVEAFQECFSAAVKARLRSRRAPCALITGGLDSSSIAVIAADILAEEGSRLNTYTAVPEAGFVREELRGRYFDETPYVRQIAEANPNLTPHFISPSQGPMLEQIADQVRLGGSPAGSMLNGLWIMDILRAARSAGHDVMLGGELGNFTMSYDGYGLFTELFRTGRWLRLFREITACGHRWKYTLRHRTIAPFIPAPLFRRYKEWRRGGKPPWYYSSLIRPEFAARSGVVDRAAREYLALDGQPPRNGRLGRINAFHSYCEACDWFAKMRVGFGIDIRTPAFDRRLVEFCIGIPEDQYVRNGCNRWLIRRAMKRRLPDVVLYNKKTGAQAADWYPRLTRERDQIAGEVKRLAVNAEVASIVDLQRLTAILDAWPDRQPLEYGTERMILSAIPQALGAAYFIENVTGANYRSTRTTHQLTTSAPLSARATSC